MEEKGFERVFSREWGSRSLKRSDAMEDDVLLHILQPGRCRSQISITQGVPEKVNN